MPGRGGDADERVVEEPHSSRTELEMRVEGPSLAGSGNFVVLGFVAARGKRNEQVHQA